MLLTPRLILAPASVDQVRAIIQRDYLLASTLVGADVPDGWPGEPEAIEGLPWHLSALEADPQQQLWRIRFVIEKLSNSLIGSVNLKGMPTSEGDVEIGWGIVREARGRGFATEASLAVVDWAFRTGDVRRVLATVPDDNVMSQNVARRLGMAKTGETKRGIPLWAVARLPSPTRAVALPPHS